MNNPYYPRRSGRTTWMYIRLLARVVGSDQEVFRVSFPTLQMAKLEMEKFAELVQRISSGACEIKVIKSKMKVYLLGKEIIFDGLDRPRDERGCMVVIDEFKDHTCYEEPWSKK